MFMHSETQINFQSLHIGHSSALIRSKLHATRPRPTEELSKGEPESLILHGEWNSDRRMNDSRSSQLQPTAQQYVNFSPFHIRQISMGVHLRMMNESFFSIHGVPESINISKKPLCQNFHLFSSFKIFSNFMPYSRDVRSTFIELEKEPGNTGIL